MSINNQENTEKAFYPICEGIAEGTIFKGGKSDSCKVFPKNMAITLTMTPTSKDAEGKIVNLKDKAQYPKFTMFSSEEESNQTLDRLFNGGTHANVVLKFSYSFRFDKEAQKEMYTMKVLQIEPKNSHAGAQMVEKFANRLHVFAEKVCTPKNHERTYDGAPVDPDKSKAAATDDLPF